VSIKPKAFLSSSFADEDKAVVAAVIGILNELGIEFFQADVVPVLPDSIIGKVIEYELFIAVLTPREGRQISNSVASEIGMALATNKNLILLRDDNLPVQPFWRERFQLAFNRSAVERLDAKALENLKNGVIRQCQFYGYNLAGPDQELQRRYKFAQDHAVLLGSKVLGFFHDILYQNEVRDKVAKNFPTKADRRANRFIIEAIESDALTKDDGIISEESERDSRRVKPIIEEFEFVWIIDPLDGTLNFAYNFPFFCVSLGLLREGRPVLGVLYNPTDLGLYCGMAGYPSECLNLASGTRQPLALASKKTKLEDCIVMSHLSSNAGPRRKTIEILDAIMDNCRAVRMLGSGQMALASLGLGQFDIFFNYQTNIWDIVPGYVILKGAGGYITTSLSSGDAWNWQSRGVVAASNAIIGEKFRNFLYNRLGSDFPLLES